MNIQKTPFPQAVSQKEKPTKKSYRINKTWYFSVEKGSIQNETGHGAAIRAKTIEVLCLLIENVNQTVSVDTFLETVWSGRYPGENVLRQSIFELRTIFKEDDSDIIKTVPKQGYRLNAEIETVFSTPDEEQTTTDKEADASGESLIAVKKALSVRSLLVIGISFLLLSSTAFIVYYKKPDEPALQITAVTHHYFSATPVGATEDIFSFINKNSDTENLADTIESYYTFIKQESLPDGTKFEKFIAIIRIYLTMDKNKDALVVSKSLADWTKSTFRAEDIRWLIAYAYYLYNCIETGDLDSASRIIGDIQDGLNKAKVNTELYRADFHYLQAYYYLMCTYPKCDRVKAMKEGKKHAEDAVDLYAQFYGVHSIQKADALRMLNWFTPEYASDKERLLQEALAIYTDNLGDHNEAKADVLAELSRIQTVNKADMKKGEEYLLEALRIRQTIYPEGHRVVQKTLSYIGELYLAMNNKEAALQYFHNAVNNLRKNDRPSLETLIFLAKTYLYNEEKEKAQNTIRQALNLAEQYGNYLPYFLDYELKAVAIRTGIVDHSMTDSMIANADLESQKYGIQAKNSLPAAILSHEYLTLLLKRNAKILDSSRYLNTLDLLLKSYRLNHRYLVDIDIDFIKDRSMTMCSAKGEVFCQAIKEKFLEYHPKNHS